MSMQIRVQIPLRSHVFTPPRSYFNSNGFSSRRFVPAKLSEPRIPGEISIPFRIKIRVSTDAGHRRSFVVINSLLSRDRRPSVCLIFTATRRYLERYVSGDWINVQSGEMGEISKSLGN